MEGQTVGVPNKKSAHNNFLQNQRAEATSHRNGYEAPGIQKHSGDVVASSAEHDFLPGDGYEAPNQRAEAIASSAHRNGYEAPGIQKQSAASSAEYDFLPGDGSADLAGSSAQNTEGEATCKPHEAAEINEDLGSTCHRNGYDAPGIQKHSAEVVASYVEHDFLPREGSADLGSTRRAVEIVKPKLKIYTWHGLQLALPAALHLSKWCSLEDQLLEFRGSNASLREGLLSLNASSLDLQFDIVDGALWLRMPSLQFSDMLPGRVAKLLERWEKRMDLGFDPKYLVSGSSGIIYSSKFSEVLIADCCIFSTAVFEAAQVASSHTGRIVPVDLEAEVVFECVSATDDVSKTWLKCESYITSQRAKLAIGICDRTDKKEVTLAYRNSHGDVTSDVHTDPRFIDLSRVLRGFRIYLSYMIPVLHFTVHHMYDLRTMSDAEVQELLCSQIAQGGPVPNALAMEIVNGLGSVNFCDSMGRNPLVVAVSSQNIEMVHYLLENKANPEFLDGDNVCAFLYAKAQGMQMYDALRIASGREIFFGTRDLFKALNKDSPKSFELALKAVLSSSVDIDEINEDNGFTALGFVVLSRQLWAVKMLVEAGACPTKADARGTIPLKTAIFSMCEDQFLESGLLAAKNMDVEIVKSMITRGMVDDHPRVLAQLQLLWA